MFGEWIELREVGSAGQRRLDLALSLTEEITRAVRGALLRHADDPPPAVLSGHARDGRPLEQPHVAFLAVPSVCTPGDAAAVRGAAILLPRDIGTRDRAAIVCALERWERAGLRLLLGRAGVMHLARVARDEPGALGLAAWSRPSRRWASITPVALERNPGDLMARDPAKAAEAGRRAEEIVSRGCAHIGLPRPARVQVMPRSLFPAAPPASAFAPYPRKGNGFKRVCVHVEIAFEEAVAGPVVLGVGRYFGVGLCGAWKRMIEPAPDQAPEVRYRRRD